MRQSEEDVIPIVFMREVWKSDFSIYIRRKMKMTVKECYELIGADYEGVMGIGRKRG